MCAYVWRSRCGWTPSPSPAAVGDHLRDARVGQPALESEPQPGRGGAGVALANGQVAVKRLDRRRPDGEEPLAATLAHDPDEAGVQVHVVRVGLGRGPAHRHLGPAGTGVDEQPDSGRTIRTRTRRSLDVQAARLVRMTLAGMFA
jgi:hypothetical protein